MSVTVKGTMEFLKPTQVLSANPLAVEVLVNEIVTSMAEGSIDMVCDGGPAEYPTKQDIESCLGGCADMGIDFVEDMINELRDKLVARLRAVQIKPVVKEIHFDAEGYSDIVVDIEIV